MRHAGSKESLLAALQFVKMHGRMPDEVVPPQPAVIPSTPEAYLDHATSMERKKSEDRHVRVREGTGEGEGETAEGMEYQELADLPEQGRRI